LPLKTWPKKRRGVDAGLLGKITVGKIPGGTLLIFVIVRQIFAKIDIVVDGLHTPK